MDVQTGMESNPNNEAIAEFSDEVIVLHGDIDVKIVKARCLPNMDMFSEHFRRMFAMCRSPIPRRSTKDKVRKHKIITSDPYVTVILARATVAKTRVISNCEDPVWEERFELPVAHPISSIEFHVKDNDMFGAQMIGVVRISAKRIASGEEINDWFPVLGPNGKPPKPDSALFLCIKFKTVELNPIYQNGIAADRDVLGVKHTYFPARKGGMVKLYQDAHVNDGDLPEIELDDGVSFVHGKCWEDICHAILEAHHLIYLVGWSIYDKVRLIRESSKPVPPGGELTLGELLKYKSQEGVRVCMLVWDDKTSHDKFIVKTAGVMGTHDEETRKFFKHSSVICVLSPRYASSKVSIFKQQVVGTLYTHHQKCVLVDTQAGGNKRKVTAFIGGLDLCDGRYDTPEHRLFRDLDTVFENDFHNPTFAPGAKGPRQPWHDLHCRLEGPAAYDVLTNFEQRWRKATKWKEFRGRFRRESRWNDDAMIQLDRISWILSPSETVSRDDPSLWVTEETEPENWHVQIFRSIDSGSLKGFPKDRQVAKEQNLIGGKNIVIEKSIHTAYIAAIRSAQHFIYIENQYFLGSSFGWLSYNNPAADNLIPMELALKIASKIKANERFAVYVIIPMWPEGIPNTAAVQEILFWQYQTIQMMYDIIAKELKSSNLEDSHPQDYLNFYCLGNREQVPHDAPVSNNNNSDKSAAALCQKFRRFMIYVHAKGMIVDDEYVLLGSANINQRSLDGKRDTEIAMGAYQHYHSWAVNRRHPHGQVYGYRMSLWAEHLGFVDDLFKEPYDVECVRKVNKIANANWTKFCGEEHKPLEGHLLKYPILVGLDGKVTSIPDQTCFPDVGGKILGAPTNLPDSLTM
ncbi:Phospholipase D delta [Zostera marina]|uniref:Phospholipase D n=1 Tax=Zostera marina TaxID=29655 RepID=A0A0K9PUD4_ZOSMR|nr:Phospholipase D delta [Zostera marina]